MYFVKAYDFTLCIYFLFVVSLIQDLCSEGNSEQLQQQQNEKQTKSLAVFLHTAVTE